MSENFRFENYELLRKPDGAAWELGRGAMGVTYKARDTDLHCDVALKIINPSILSTPEVEERFLREARAAAKLRHPNIATVFRLGVTEDGTHYYAMEFCDGQTLQQMIEAGGPLPAANAVHLAWQVSRALRVAEEHRLIHRDLKPANLVVVETPDDGLVVKVIDFGLAKSFAGGHQTFISAAQGFAGTAHFASPEQIDEQDLDIRSDFYSLGASLWFMLDGHPPFEGSAARVMSQTLSGDLPWTKLAGQPEPVLALLHRMLAKNRDDRPVSAAALRGEMERCMEAINAEAHRTEPPTIAARQAAPEENRLTARFALGERTGRDALGRVFRAIDLENGGAPVTYRIIEPALTAVPEKRRELEAQFTAACAHPHRNLVNVLAFAFTDQGHVVVTEMTEGLTLLDLLKRRGALPPQEALLLLSPLAAAADHAAAYRLRGFSLGKAHTWVHFPNSASAESRRRALAEPVCAWPGHELKVEVISPEAPLGGDAEAAQSMATLANPGKGFGLTQRTPSSALAHLTCELLGGAGDSFMPIATLREDANAILRRACAEPAAYPTASAFLQALGPALGKAPARPHSPPRPDQVRDTLAQNPASAPPYFSRWSRAIAAGVLIIAGSLAYYYGIHAPNERDREIRARSEKTPSIDPNAPVHKPLAQESPKVPNEPGQPAEKEPGAGNASTTTQAGQGNLAKSGAEASDKGGNPTAPVAPPVVPAVAPPPEPPKTGRVLINTIPPRATVLLDGKDNGTSPMLLEEATNGIHRVHIQLTGYEPVDLIVDVRGGATSDPGTINLAPRKADIQATPGIQQFFNLPGPPARPVNALEDDSVRALVRNELAATARGDLGAVVACYTFPVDFYDEGRKSATGLRHDLEIYRQMWPLIEISNLSVINVSATHDPEIKTASYSYVFVARNPQNGKQSQGVAHEEISVRLIGGRYLIFRCRQNITDRTKNFRGK